MDDSRGVFLRRALPILGIAVVAILAANYLYQGARRAQAEARLADARAVQAMRGSPMFGCIASGGSVEMCYERDLEARRRRAEAQRAAVERRREEATTEDESVCEDDRFRRLRELAGEPCERRDGATTEEEPAPDEEQNPLDPLARLRRLVDEYAEPVEQERDPLARLRALAEGGSSVPDVPDVSESEDDQRGRLDGTAQHGQEWDTAMHEAAHAVVSVRLGLPLESTDIIAQPRLSFRGDTIPSGGYTTLPKGTTQRWLEALPDLAARRNLEAFAAQGAAGMVAEKYLGSADDDPAVQTDLTAVIAVADNLGIGRNPSEPQVRAFIMEAIARAEAALTEDGGGAWERVAEALLERRALSGDDVRQIVSAGASR